LIKTWLVSSDLILKLAIIYQLQTFTSTSISLLASMPFGIMINVMLS